MHLTNITAIKSEECTACEACANICPQHAITMSTDVYGFFYPQVIADKCTACGLCLTHCPLNTDYFHSAPSVCYANMATDKLRLESSSGGSFSLLAEQFLSSGGYVCGAAFTDSFAVEHIIIDNLADLPRLRTSKYIQSRTNTVFKQIKQLLTQKYSLLFCGTPCQVAGLKSFLELDYDNLYTLDIICHGVPSYKIFQKYLTDNFPNETIQKINFRGKQNGWNYNYVFTLRTEQNTYSIPANECSYLQAFVNGLSIRPSCFLCNFAKSTRVGDLTLGDFWGIEAIDPSLNDGKGTSLLLVNSTKGQLLLHSLKEHSKLLQICDVEVAKQFNPKLTHPLEVQPLRSEFLADLQTMPFNNNVKDKLSRKFDCAILNLWWSNNYGAALTAYALQQSLTAQGYSSRLVKYYNDLPSNRYHHKQTDRFARKHLSTTNLYTKDNLASLNEQTDCFIVGSDQVFRRMYNTDNHFLTFVDYSKKKIAFAASFGKDSFECSDPRLLKEYRFWLSRFDYLSVRELSGVAICRNTFGLTARQIIDPVFMLDKSQWQALAAHSKFLTSEKYLFKYILDSNPDIDKQVEKIASQYNLQIIEPLTDGEIVDWLYLIQESEMVVTDSFHGVCFALLYNKPFLSIVNIQRGADRFISIKEQLALPAAAFVSEEEFLAQTVSIPKIDYACINANIMLQREQALYFLQVSMQSKKLIDKNGAIKELHRFQKLHQLPLQHRLRFFIKKYFYKTLYLLLPNAKKFKGKYQKYKDLLK